MSFFNKLIGRFRKTTPAPQTAVAEDMFDIRLRKMQGRQRLAPQSAVFRKPLMG